MSIRHALTPAVLTAAAVVLAACGGGNGAEPANSSESAAALGPDRWMEAIYANHPDTPLGQVIIPGTHDSGSYGINVNAPCPIVPASGTNVAIDALGASNPCAAAGMYRAQDQNLAAQLQDGIRYLDLRVSVPRTDTVTSAQAASADPAQVPFVLEHEFVSTPLKGALDEVLTFAKAHPKEQVILDFQHIDLAKDADTTYYYNALQSLLKSYAPAGASPVCDLSWNADKLQLTPAKLSGVTLGQAWDAGANLVVLVPNGTLSADSCYYERNSAIMSQWPNTEDPATSVAYNQKELVERQQRLAASPQQCSNEGKDAKQGDNWCGFFVSQMQLTFQPATFVGCIEDTKAECSLYAYSEKVNNTVANKVQDWRIAQALPVNIVIVDYFNNSDPSYTRSLIGINQELAAGKGASADPGATALPSPSGVATATSSGSATPTAGSASPTSGSAAPSG